MTTRAAREALLRRFPARVIRRALAQQEMMEIVSVENGEYSGPLSNLRMHVISELEISKSAQFLAFSILGTF
jgi:hypothetical protein